jgi:nucleoside-diphosphate-sugar epimerase
MTCKRTVFVLGATGGIGGEVALALLQGGWRVRSLHREPERAARRATHHLAGVEWVAGDAMRREDVVAAAEGADVIVHGVNPPGYRNWGGLALPMLENSIAAANASGARLVFPGTVYNFGPDAFPTLSERSPQNPTTRKGKIAWKWSSASKPPAGTACARSSCAPATSSGLVPATAGLRKA